jgi:hypothetical protein
MYPCKICIHSLMSYLLCTDLALDCIFEDSGDSSSSDDWNTNQSMMELARQRRAKKSMSADNISDSTVSNQQAKLVGPVPLSAELHRDRPIPSGYNKLKQASRERLSKTRLNTGKTSNGSAIRGTGTADRWVCCCTMYHRFVLSCATALR